MPFWTAIWDTIWWFLTFFVFIAYLFALFNIIIDLFRDRKLNGWFKAIWLVFLMLVPFVTALVYLIARGRGMGERSARQSQEMREATDEYIRSVNGDPGAVGEISRAKALLDSGAISAEEFERLKAAALKKVG